MKNRYTGRKTWDNGTKEEQDFEYYDEMCDWLAESPEAGISARHNEQGIDLDQQALQDDVALSGV